MKILCFIICGLFGAALTLGAAQTHTAKKVQTDSVLASVNGEPISLSDVMFETQNEEYYLVNSLEKEKAARAIYDLRKKVLEDLIDRKLILIEFKKKPFPIDNQQVSVIIDDMAVRANCRTRSEFYAKLRESGLSVDEFKRKVEERLTVQYVVGRELYINVHVSPKEVYEYYNTHMEEFSSGEKVRVNILFLNRANADFAKRSKEVADRLAAAPTDFYSLLREYSELPGGKKTDFAILVDFNDLRPEFKKLISKKTLNQLIGPLEIKDEGVYYLLADKFVQGDRKTLDEVRTLIIKKLEEKKREDEYRRYVKRLRERSIIRYMY